MTLAALLLIAALLAFGLHKVLWALEGIEHQVRHLNIKGARIMATVEELVQKVKEMSTAVVGGIDEAIVELNKIGDLLDAGTGSGVDVDGAVAAIDEVLAKLTALKAAVDRPEPGTPPVEPPV